MEPKRLNKFISDSGFCSRREADRLIEEGRVTVNGKIPDAGTKVTAKDKVRIDEQLLNVREEEPVYIVFNKPAGMSATSDQAVRDNIIRAINYPASLQPIGHLDREAEGLIFLSNDSDFVRKMSRADNRYEKEYVVTVDKLLTSEFLSKIGGGEVPEQGASRRNSTVSKEASTRFRIVLEPGTDHHIKRMCENLGYKVVHLQRVRVGSITLAKLSKGFWRTLTPAEVEAIKGEMKGGKASKSRQPDLENIKDESPVGRSGSRPYRTTSKPGRPGAASRGEQGSTTGRRDTPKGGATSVRGSRGVSRGTVKGAANRNSESKGGSKRGTTSRGASKRSR